MTSVFDILATWLTVQVDHDCERLPRGPPSPPELVEAMVGAVTLGELLQGETAVREGGEG
jgi:hypothetical protein